MVKNWMVDAGVIDESLRVPLILGVWGPKGCGKTFQLELVFKKLGARWAWRWCVRGVARVELAAGAVAGPGRTTGRLLSGASHTWRVAPARPLTHTRQAWRRW